MLRHVVGDDGADTYTFGSPIRLSEHEPLAPMPVSTLGAQNDEVLGALASTRGANDGG